MQQRQKALAMPEPARLPVQGLGFLEFRIWGLGFLGFRMWGLGLKDLGCRIWGLGVSDLGFRGLRFGA